MQITLGATNQSFEIQTIVAGSIHYQIGYTDVTASSVSNPIDSNGIISSATTTVAVAAPASTTTRKIQYVNIFNNGIPNTIILKKDIGGTEIILLRISLGQNETLRIINDKVETLDPSGRVKLQNQGDSEITGEVRSIYKVGTAPEAAGVMYSHSKDSGFPGAWSVGTPGLNGRNTNGSLAPDTGCINVGSPGAGAWYLRDINMSGTVAGQFNLFDVLWVNSGLVVTTLTAQAITQPTLPPRDNNGSTSGLGIYAGILVTVSTGNAAAIANTTLTYTNSDGVAGRTGTITSFPATATVGTFVPFQLQAGDKGIQSIQSITLGTSYVSGTISLICFNPMASNSIPLPNSGSLSYQRKLDLRLYDGHCLLPFWFASATTTVTINGNIYFVNK
jgi:hypothetical protein